MQRVINMEGHQSHYSSIFMPNSNSYKDELVQCLMKIQKSMISGDLERGLRTVRELLKCLALDSSQKGSKLMEHNNIDKFKNVESSELNKSFSLRIYTMGRFSVVVAGKPIIFRTKAQKKPMDLLKTLIALGGRGISKSQLTDLLWPDSAGDASVSVINTTLSRLRKLIGKDAIQTNNGCLSLNPRYCWVDCWEFERLLNVGNNRMGTNSDVVTQIFDLYQGHFLAGEESGWLVSRREKLRNKLLHVCSRHVSMMMDDQQFKLASHMLLKCIEIDDLNENFYIALIRCHIHLNQLSEAAMIYRRCQKSLATYLGIQPSEVCQKLYLSIQGI